MLRTFKIENFKSYRRKSELPLSDLTVLVGANASGKSNLIESLRLLCWLARGRRLGDLLHAIEKQEIAVRGKLADLLTDGQPSVKFWADMELNGTGPVELAFWLALRDDGFHVGGETLVTRTSRVPLYRVAGAAAPGSNDITIAYDNFSRGGKKPRIVANDQQPVFSQLQTPARFAQSHVDSQRRIPPACAAVQNTLTSVLFLDPNPGNMRGYSHPVEKSLRDDGSNLSGVLWNLCKETRHKRALLDFVRQLPEQDIADLDFLTAPRDEVMLQLHETFGGHRTPRPAALLSDGSLRILAIAGALLSVGEGSLVVIEEIDNGVHPSRAAVILKKVYETAAKRKLNVLLSTHNPALLDALPAPAVGSTVFCYRDPLAGDSRLVRLSDLKRFPDLVAQGPLGALMTSRVLDEFVKRGNDEDERRKNASAVLDDLRRGLR